MAESGLIESILGFSQFFGVFDLVWLALNYLVGFFKAVNGKNVLF